MKESTDTIFLVFADDSWVEMHQNNFDKVSYGDDYVTQLLQTMTIAPTRIFCVVNMVEYLALVTSGGVENIMLAQNLKETLNESN